VERIYICWQRNRNSKLSGLPQNLSLRSLLISAHVAVNIVQKIWDIYAICGQAQVSFSKLPQKGLTSRIDACKVTQNESYWYAISQRLLTALLEKHLARAET